MKTATTAALRFHETLAGRGKAYDGARLLAEVDYLIKDVEETYGTAPVGRGEAAEAGAGQRNIYGLVRSPGAEVLGGYVGARLTLQLEDGRRLHFTVAKVMGTDAFLIQGLGRLH